MLSRITTVQECDATKADSSTGDDKIKIFKSPFRDLGL
jgi:hypothetical protein